MTLFKRSPPSQKSVSSYPFPSKICSPPTSLQHILKAVSLLPSPAPLAQNIAVLHPSVIPTLTGLVRSQHHPSKANTSPPSSRCALTAHPQFRQQKTNPVSAVADSPIRIGGTIAHLIDMAQPSSLHFFISKVIGVAV